MTPQPAKVFLSYSHKDEAWKDRVVGHLAVLAREGRLEVWQDRQIAAGGNWRSAIQTALERCDVALLLISKDFLNSDFIQGEEVPRLIERRLEAGVIVIPVIVWDCAWQDVGWLSPLLARPKDGKPLTSFSRKSTAEAALAALAKEVLALVQAGTSVAPPEESKPPITPVEAAALRSAYLHRLVDRVGAVDLAAIDPGAVAAEGCNPLSLDAIYTSLLVKAVGDPERPRQPSWEELVGYQRREEVSALAQLDEHDRLVNLGDPGSGKSTFLHFVALCHAGELLGRSPDLAALCQPLPEDDGEPSEETQPWRHGPLLPVPVVLRDFASRGLPAAGELPTAGHLWDFLAAELKREGLGDYAPFLRKELLETGGLVLLDGFDEVPEAGERREQLREAVRCFAVTFHRCRLVLSSRTYAYQRQEWRLPDFRAAVLAPFQEGQIRRFVRSWYGVAARRGSVAPDVAPERTEKLIEAIFRSEHLAKLAERPLLLTLMASHHAYSGRDLPEKREPLYDATVELLLYRWEQQRRIKTPRRGDERQEPSLSAWLEADREAIRRELEALAFEVHRRQLEAVGTAGVPETELVDRLMGLRRRPAHNPAELLEYLRDRAGILLPRGVKLYAFYHRSFQEYLAACHLALGQGFPDDLAELARQDPERWREVTLLAGARASATAFGPIWDLAEALCGTGPAAGSAGARDLWGAHLAGLALVERRVPLENLPERYRRRLKRLQQLLTATLGAPELPAWERALAGQSLAYLGDPRRSVITLDEMEFCFVPAGPLTMGSKEDDAEESGVEIYQHQCEVPYDFWIARFPLTGAQWRQYLEDSRRKPKEEGSLDVPANEPAAWVSWEEALACCRWLTSHWRERGLLPKGWKVRLPSEAEWEKAARGGNSVLRNPRREILDRLWVPFEPLALRPNEKPARSYPWGEEEDPDLANCGESRIGRPSAVGCFPLGASPYGVEELSGNVAEWTRTLWSKHRKEPRFAYPYRADDGREHEGAGRAAPRVVRGGSCVSSLWYGRSACRRGYLPDVRNADLGFRVVLSSFFSEH